MTSRFEWHPMALIEALSYGLPCIVTVGSSMKEEIRRYDAGWVCNSTLNELANAIEKMVPERNEIYKKSAGPKKLAKSYLWEKYCSLYSWKVCEFDFSLKKK